MTVPEIIPAIDVMGGRCVRLWRGEAEKVTVYDADPVTRAAGYAEQGAGRLHLVDLDAAFGRPSGGLEVLRRVSSETGLPVQFGGGLRTMELLERASAAGAAWMIAGTAALDRPGFLTRAVETWGPRLILALDLRGGRPVIGGWLRKAGVGLEEALGMAAAAGVGTVLITDTAGDGTLRGVRPENYSPALGLGIDIQAAGGVASLEDIRLLAAMSPRGLRGIVVGSALLRGDFLLEDACRAAAAAPVSGPAPATGSSVAVRAAETGRPCKDGGLELGA